MEVNKNVEVIENADFYASAFLIASGYPPQSHQISNGIVTFNFQKSEKVESLLDQYYALQGSINPAQFVSAIKSLKSIIYKNKHKPNNMNGSNQWNRKQPN
jgi:hypothetical protein